MASRRVSLHSFQMIILGFALTIACGTALLMLPDACTQGRATFLEALFTATSAVCVTGLVVQDTALYWTTFGQGIILVLIQIGGMGIISVALLFHLFSGHRISLAHRQTLSDALSVPWVGGIVELAGFILCMILAFETLGAGILAFTFYPLFGRQGIWMAVFHSVSAFCNAGFDIMGAYSGQFSSLTAFADNPVVVLTVSGLIITGGIGFLTWEDFRRHGFRFRRFQLQSRVILVTTAGLILIPTVLLYITDFRAYSLGSGFLRALFQAVTPRTAGFNTVDFGNLSRNTLVLIIFLMLVGGAPGSTAGGMKVTTLAVLTANCRAIFLREKHVRCGDRRLEDSVVKSAAAILFLYVVLSILGAMAISALEGLSLGVCIFETASAIATVGLSLGITPGLGAVSRLILISFMFLGRVGGLTLIFAAVPSRGSAPSRLPMDKIAVG